MATCDLVVERVQQNPAASIRNCDLLSDRANGAFCTKLVLERCREGLKTAALRQ
jgi:hypothetical protein